MSESRVRPSDVHRAAEVVGVGPSPMIRARPRRRRIHVPGPSLGIGGRIRWGLFDAESGALKRSSGLLAPHRGWYSNLILDTGLDYVGDDVANSAVLNMARDTMAVGSDSTSPAAGQTSLGNEVARTNNKFAISEGSGPNFDYWWWRGTWEFTKAEANATLAELATLDSGSSTHWMRQLFRDAQGNPTTISKQNDEILRVQYEHRIYPDKTVKDKTFDLDIRGSLVTTTIHYQPQEIDEPRAWGRSSFGDEGYLGTMGDWRTSHFVNLWEDNTRPGDFQSAGPVDDSVGGSDIVPISGSLSSYSNGQFYRDWTFVIGATDANFAQGIGSVAVSPWKTHNETHPGFISFFDPRIDKTDSDELELTFRASWSRVSV